MDVLLVAAKKEKIADYTERDRARPGGSRWSSTSTPSPSRTPTRPTTASTRRGRRAAERRRQRDQHQHRQRRAVGLHPRHLDRRQRLHRGGAEGAEPAVRGRRAAEEGRAGRRARASSDVRPVLRAVTENVLLEIQKTFDFFKATAASDRIDRIVLSGGASRVDGFAEMLRGAVRRAGGALRPVPEGRVRRAASSGSSTSPRRGAGGGRGRGPRAPTGGRPMIRINLLAVERDRDQAAAAERTPGDPGRRSRSAAA